MYIDSIEALRELYGFAKGRAKDKQLSGLEKHSTNFINLSPFMVMSTFDKAGLVDCSPRGGSRGFIKVLNDKTIIIPDAKGNNRLDSLCNIIETGRVGCLFLIPGVDETLRINAEARISIDAKHLELFSDERNTPKSCIELNIKEVFLHCAKALMRSQLWSAEAQVERASLPTMGAMINDQLSISEPSESQEDMVDRYSSDL